VATDPRRWGLSHTLGLVAVAIALAVALPLSASIAIGGVKDVKRQARDTIVVTGSARHPIAADLATWRISVGAQARTPAQAIAQLRAEAAQVDAFLARGGLAASAVSKPPIGIARIAVSVPTGLKKPAFRQVPAWRVSQSFAVQTTQIDVLQRVASQVGDLLAEGTGVSVTPIQYLSTKLTAAKFAALRLAVADARERASQIAKGLDAKLGSVQQTSLGVYQITPRNSTEVSDYGLDDTSSRLKDVEAVVNVTFQIDR
jgi:hypothetical protein